MLDVNGGVDWDLGGWDVCGGKASRDRILFISVAVISLTMVLLDVTAVYRHMLSWPMYESITRMLLSRRRPLWKSTREFLATPGCDPLSMGCGDGLWVLVGDWNIDDGCCCVVFGGREGVREVVDASSCAILASNSSKWCC